LRWSFGDGKFSHGVEQPRNPTEAVQELGRGPRDDGQLEGRLHPSKQMSDFCSCVDLIFILTH
jgi:hypothetical protein